jgi:hypothetical protein
MAHVVNAEFRHIEWLVKDLEARSMQGKEVQLSATALDSVIYEPPGFAARNAATSARKSVTVSHAKEH